MAETENRNARKLRTGIVVSISGNKSVTVKIDYRKHHVAELLDVLVLH